ncbi:MAG: hypothetical protein HYX84_08560 [Chloroflexi bacterium]|nr:hypothetical protein [Chloroflexota bacterium]
MVGSKVRTRKATMTNKQRIEALFRREKPDRVPHWPFIQENFAVLYAGGEPADRYLKSMEWNYEAGKKTCRDFDWVFAPNLSVRPRGTASAFGGERKLPTSKYSQDAYVSKFPASTPEEVMALKVPDLKACVSAEMEKFSRMVYADRDDNMAFVTAGSLGVMNAAAGIAGYDNLCKWMIKYPEVAHRLCRLAVDNSLQMAQYVKDNFGTERVVITGANAGGSNQLIGPKHFEQFALPYLKEAHQKVIDMGFKHLCQHPCGDHNLNLPFWAQVPMGDPGIVYVANEIDLEKAARFFPNDIIRGNMETTIVQCGTPGEVYEEARKVIEQGKRLPGGFIFAQACGIPPRAPIENVHALTRALNDFGWYD